MTKIGVNLFLALFLFSCVARDNVDPATTERNIYVVSREATITALTQAFDHEDSLELAASLVAELDLNVLPVLSEPSVNIDRVVADNLLNAVPLEFRGLMGVAYVVFNTYYYFPEEVEFLPEPQLSYLRAFLKGVRDGSKFVLQKNGVTLNVKFTLTRVSP